MSSRRPGLVVCLSYLAAAALWRVPRFPLANHGAEVLTIEQSIAADAPMVAAALAAFGVPVLLLANDLGEDAQGTQVERWLERYRVPTTAAMVAEVTTPQIVVVADDAGSRAWFPFLPGVVDSLAALDLAPVDAASFAYVDCYQLIEAPAVRAIHAIRAAGTPLLLNLGGSALSPAVAGAVRECPGLVVQTNIDDAAHRDGPPLAAALQAATAAEWAVVTAGSAGAVAAGEERCLAVPAFRASVRHTHCAGAAFSAGLLYGLIRDRPMAESLTLACASGAVRCERAHHEPMPTLAELRALISSRERIGMPAA
jgi:sugar/nucleoside kinase (ribokinase family)